MSQNAFRGQASFWASASLLVLFAVMVGCAPQKVRDEAQGLLAAGQYEAALTQLEAGLKAHPDSTLLRAGLIQAQAEVQAKLVTQAGALRAAGKLNDAQRELERARTLDPSNLRVTALLDELTIERRMSDAAAQAEAYWQRGLAANALKAIETALRDSPRHARLLALQRQIEAAQRQAGARAAQTALAETRPISLDFRDANLRTVLDVVSRSSGINFILDKDIRTDTRVSVFLRETKLEEALDLIINTNQLAKKVVDTKTILVYPNTPDKQREYQEQIVRVFHLANADAKSAAAFLRAMLKIRDPFVDERTNMLSLRDSQENVQLAERLLALFDSAEPEVLLEVEVLEVSSTRLTELGVKFPAAVSLSPLAPAGAAGLTLANIESLGRDRVGVGVGGLTLNLRRETGDFTTLANPRLRTRNKEKARILIGDKIPIVTTTTGVGGFVSDSISYLDVGLKLEVEPTVYADDDVAIRISLEVSTLGAAVKTAAGALAYQIGTRNAATVLRLHDGETQLLAGLISREERTSASRLPGVGDLPVLGRLFSNQLDNAQRSELVLAITPRVLRNIRRADATETELWVGTDAAPRLRMAGGAGAPVVGPSATAAPMRADTPPATAPRLALPPAAPTLALSWAGPTTAKSGDEFDVQLSLSTSAALRGLPTSLRFDPQRLQLLGVVEGAFFKRDGAVTSFTHTVDAKAGQLQLGVMRNAATSATGDADFVTLKFKALTPGRTQLTIEKAQAISMTDAQTPQLSLGTHGVAVE
jgi:general secretion pathway protein D